MLTSRSHKSHKKISQDIYILNPKLLQLKCLPSKNRERKRFSSVQSSRSVMSDSLWSHGLQHARLPCHHQLPELAQIHVYRVGDANQPFHPLLVPPSIFPSIRVFSRESVLGIRWPKCRSFSFSISPSNEYSGLISFRMDWLDLLAVQGILKNLLQHHSSKASVLRCSAFFMVQLTSIHDYWKNHTFD